MSAFWRHALQAAYLYAQQETPLGVWPAGVGWWIGCLSLSLALGGLLWRRHPTRWTPRLIVCGSALSLAAYLARPWVMGPYSARIWTYIWALPTLGLWLALGLRRLGAGRWGRPQMAALVLALGPAENPASAGWLVIHALGLALLGQLGGLLAAGLAGLCLTVAALAQRAASGRWDRLGLRPELLAPLWLAYASGLLHRLLTATLGVDVAPYAAFPYAEPFALLVDPPVMLTLACLWMLLATGIHLWRVLGWPLARATVTLAVGLLMVGLGWYGALVAQHLSHGATGSDPYCYLQMATDWVERGSLAHPFPLAELARAAQVPVWPVVPVGYQLPDAQRLATTVWPMGWPVLLAPLYALGGERLALWGAPLWHVLGAALTLGLAWRVLRERSPALRHLWAAVAAALTLTSLEAAERSLVPMADAAATALTAATLLALYHARARRSVAWSALAGLSFGLAYLVRHPLLPLAVAALPMLAWRTRQPWARLPVFSVAALAVALPDLLYHARWFGSPWVAESPEWFLISWRHIPATMAAMLRDGWLRRGEFGPLWPLVAVGIWALWRSGEGRAQVAGLAGAFLGLLAFSLCYQALRWRDLLALVPILSVWAVAGLAWLWHSAGARHPRRAGLLLVLLLCLGQRAREVAPLPWAAQAPVFGHVTRTQRAAYETLSGLIPPDALIATGLGAGAVTRYTARETVRPEAWTAPELARFVAAASASGRALYWLDDGEAMDALAFQEDIARRLVYVADLPLPTFGLGGEPLERRAILYRWHVQDLK